MSDSIRQKIVESVKTRFAAILIASGYQTNIGQRVFLCRPTQPKETDLPVLNIWDLREQTRPLLSKVHEHTLEIEVFIMCGNSKGEALAEYIRNVISDLMKAIGTDRRWSDLAVDTEPGDSEYELDSETKQLTGTVRFRFKIKYRTLFWDALTVA